MDGKQTESGIKNIKRISVELNKHFRNHTCSEPKDYTYFCDDGQLVFLVDKNQVIRAIKIEPLVQEKYKTALSVK